MRGTGAQRQFWETGNIGNDDFDFGQQGNKATEPEHDTANKMTHVHSEDADLPRNPSSLIRVFHVGLFETYRYKRTGQFFIWNYIGNWYVFF